MNAIAKRARIIGLLAMLCLASGCRPPTVGTYPDRIDVFYRNFGFPQPFIAWSEADLMRLAPYKMTLTDETRIRQLHDMLPTDCTVEPEGRGTLKNVYLVVREYRDSILVRTFSASPFVYTVVPANERALCKLPARERDEIDALLMAMIGEKPD